jgi:hypothetical protein
MDSILISTPAAGATVPSNFTAAGSVNPGNSKVTVTLSNGTNSYGPFNANVALGGSWSYTFQNVAAGSGYTLTACIAGTTTCAQNDNITVQ